MRKGQISHNQLELFQSCERRHAKLHTFHILVSTANAPRSWYQYWYAALQKGASWSHSQREHMRRNRVEWSLQFSSPKPRRSKNKRKPCTEKHTGEIGCYRDGKRRSGDYSRPLPRHVPHPQRPLRMWLQIVTFVLQVLTHLPGSRPVSLSKHGRDFDVPIFIFFFFEKRHSKQKLIVSCWNYDTACRSCNHSWTTKPAGSPTKWLFRDEKPEGAGESLAAPRCVGRWLAFTATQYPHQSLMWLHHQAAAQPGSQAGNGYLRWNKDLMDLKPAPKSLPVTPDQTHSGVMMAFWGKLHVQRVSQKNDSSVCKVLIAGVEGG